MLHEKDEGAQLIATLKAAFKAKGLTYKEIASSLAVSEMTIKRVMNRADIGVDMIQKLCSLLGITMFELMDAARSRDTDQLPALSMTQATSLADDFTLGVIYYLLDRGWKAARIREEFALTDSELTQSLIRLDSLQIIRLLPGNAIRLLRRRNADLRHALTQSRVLRSRSTEFFRNLDLSAKSVNWTSGIARLSEASFTKATEVFDSFRDEIFALGDADLHLPAKEVKWYRIFSAMVSFDPMGHRDGERGSEPKPK